MYTSVHNIRGLWQFDTIDNTDYEATGSIHKFG